MRRMRKKKLNLNLRKLSMYPCVCPLCESATAVASYGVWGDTPSLLCEAPQPKRPSPLTFYAVVACSHRPRAISLSLASWT